MSIEIERKFLVRNDDWRPLVARHVPLQQAYLGLDGGLSTRVRIIGASDASLTIKSRKAGLRRLEFEYPIPLQDGETLLGLCQGARIEKVRHIVPWQGLNWEIDVFEGDNSGLVIAEIELPDEAHAFDTPAWLGAEITGEERYYNSNLARQPFRTWAGRQGLQARPA